MNAAREYLDDPDPEVPEARPRDPKTDEAKAALVPFFAANPAAVWYERQLTVMFEQARRPRAYLQGEGFFHWIVVRALEELVEEQEIESKTLPLWTPVTAAALRSEEEILAPQMIRFFWPRGARYVARRAEAVRRLVVQFSTPDFGRALGQQGELMFDAALPTKGFMPRARNTRIWKDHEWMKTQHNLDRIFERDGIAYGAEIKNTLMYIPPEEGGVPGDVENRETLFRDPVRRLTVARV